MICPERSTPLDTELSLDRMSDPRKSWFSPLIAGGARLKRWCWERTLRPRESAKHQQPNLKKSLSQFRARYQLASGCLNVFLNPVITWALCLHQLRLLWGQTSWQRLFIFQTHRWRTWLPPRPLSRDAFWQEGRRTSDGANTFGKLHRLSAAD